MANTGSTEKTIKLGKQLKLIAVIIFLVVACLLVIHSVISIFAESKRVPGKQVPG